MRGPARALLVLVALPVAVLLGLPAPGSAAAENTTVVSLTFDGTYKSQDRFAKILASHGMAGTFYVNSGYLGYPAYLSVDQLRAIARDRNEIGGASLYGNDLTTLSESEVKKEICDDRATLAQLGFQVTSFAYPYGSVDAGVKAAAQGCGYNSGRRFTGLYESVTDCSSCPAGETLPATDDFRIRTPTQATTVAALAAKVTRAEQAGGGWVPLVFTKICVCPTEDGAITPAEFSAFLGWLAARPATTVVRTVDQVMGGPLKPVRGEPLSRLVPDPSAAIGGSPLSRSPAWTVLGLGIGQAQIIFTGVAVSVAIVITFRLATRGNRHAH